MFLSVDILPLYLIFRRLLYSTCRSRKILLQWECFLTMSFVIPVRMADVIDFKFANFFHIIEPHVYRNWQYFSRGMKFSSLIVICFEGKHLLIEFWWISYREIVKLIGELRLRIYIWKLCNKIDRTLFLLHSL